jgi:hypothetical protein
MTHKNIIAPPRETAWGFLKTATTTQRLNLAIRRIKDATEETSVPPKLEVEVRKFRISCGCCGSAYDERRVWRILQSALDPMTSITMHVIMTDMSRKGATHVFIGSMEGKTSTELGVELGQLFNIMYSCTNLVAVHGPEPNPIPDLMDVYAKTEAGIWMSKLSLDGKR